METTPSNQNNDSSSKEFALDTKGMTPEINADPKALSIVTFIFLQWDSQWKIMAGTSKVIFWPVNVLSQQSPAWVSTKNTFEIQRVKKLCRIYLQKKQQETSWKITLWPNKKRNQREKTEIALWRVCTYSTWHVTARAFCYGEPRGTEKFAPTEKYSLSKRKEISLCQELYVICALLFDNTFLDKIARLNTYRFFSSWLCVVRLWLWWQQETQGARETKKISVS